MRGHVYYRSANFFPIFIFELENYGGIGFGLGIKGAALATVVCQAIVFLIFVYMLFVKKHAYITFNLKDFSPSRVILWDIIKVGIPASLSMIIMALGQGVFNKILIHYTSFVENMLFKSLLKMKKASDEGIIDYLIIKCMKCD